MYGSLLGSGGGPSVGQPPASLGSGAPPSFKGGLPAPTMTGQMPTGSGNQNVKSAIDEVVLNLRDLVPLVLRWVHPLRDGLTS